MSNCKHAELVSGAFNVTRPDYLCSLCEMDALRTQLEKQRTEIGLLVNELHEMRDGESVVECALRTIATLRAHNVERAQELKRWQPAIEAAKAWHSNEAAIDALCEADQPIPARLRQNDWKTKDALRAAIDKAEEPK